MEKNNGAEGNLPREPYYQREQPEPRKPNIQEWNNQAKPMNRRIVNDRVYNLMKYAIWVLLAGVLLFGYSAYNDKFSDEINIPSCPTFSCPEIPPAPACPSSNVSLNCGDCNFPQNLSINLVNSS